MFETVIVPLDGSELAEAALEHAREISEKFASNLVILRTIEPVSHHLAQQSPVMMESPAAAEANIELLEEVVQAERSEATKYLESVRSSLSGKVEAIVIEGEPAESIVQLAKERSAGLIVMSSHGRGGLGRVIFGSVADAVLRHSHTPVLLVRLHEPSA